MDEEQLNDVELEDEANIITLEAEGEAVEFEYIDTLDYEGEEYGACDEYAVEDDSAEQTACMRETFSHLTATQQRRLRLYANGKTLREIAAIEEASFQSIAESIEAGRKQFLKIFRQTP